MIGGIAWLLLAAVAQGGEAAGPKTLEQLSAEGWRFFDGIDIVVNERIITHREVLSLAALQGGVENMRELEEQLPKIRLDRVHRLLEDQAGRDMGLDEAQIARMLQYEEQRRVEAVGGLRAMSEVLRARNANLQDMREFEEELLYSELWKYWQNGIHYGPRGRISRDRYVRPGVLKMIHGFDPNQFDEPARVRLRQLVLLFPADAPDEDREEVEQVVVELRDRILAGEDMAQLVEAYGRTPPGTGGLSDLLEEDSLSRAYPEIREFLAAHPAFVEPAEGQTGPLSDVMPYVGSDGQHTGYMVLRLEQRVPERDFSDPAIQAKVRRERLTDLDELRISSGHQELLRQAYVWFPGIEEPQASQPAELPGPRPAPGSPEAPATGAPVGPALPDDAPTPPTAAPTQAPAEAGDPDAGPAGSG